MSIRQEDGLCHFGRGELGTAIIIVLSRGGLMSLTPLQWLESY